MRIEGLSAPTVTTGSIPTPAPSTPPGGIQSALQAALQGQTQPAGGKGGGGGHGGHASKALTVLEDIAARESVQVTRRGKTQAERIAEMEKLGEQMSDDARKVGEREPNPDEQEERRESNSGSNRHQNSEPNDIFGLF